MERRSWIIVAAAVSAVLAAGAGEKPLEAPAYEVTAVQRKLFRVEPEPEIQLAVGARPESGQLLRTGARSSAEITARDVGARFRLSAKTRARLAGDRPGLLLEVQRGRVRAVFDKLLGDDPPDRLVTTPTAVLAVRGTEYGVEVKKSGDTTIIVFAGEVEVTDVGHVGSPVILKAGEYGKVRRGKAPSEPKNHQMSRGEWDSGQRTGSMSRRGSMDPARGSGQSGNVSSRSGAASQPRTRTRPNHG
jgi:hypothetical protein